MKLVIQIPCYNEEESLPLTLADLPTSISGISEIIVLIINDGSRDRTVEVAKEHGVKHIISHRVNRGLAQAFRTGLTASLELGADIIVNTDADNQYPARYIPELLKPILEGRAEMVIGNRQTNTIEHFSPMKRILQSFGSAVVRFVSQSDVPDAPSGFRAFSRNAALRMNTFTRYTYTLETIIQAANNNISITSIPIQTNPKLRESRLIKNIATYVMRSASTILLLFLLYQPFRFFAYLSLPFFMTGVALWLRYAYIWLFNEPERGANVQSIIVGGVALILALLVFMMGLLGQLISFNRRLQEELLFQIKQQQYVSTSLLQVQKEPSKESKPKLNQNP